jgi:hypothetical protein
MLWIHSAPLKRAPTAHVAERAYYHHHHYHYHHHHNHHNLFCSSAATYPKVYDDDYNNKPVSLANLGCAL